MIDYEDYVQITLNNTANRFYDFNIDIIAPRRFSRYLFGIEPTADIAKDKSKLYPKFGYDT